MRTSVMVAVVIVAESLPKFGPLLDLVGRTLKLILLLAMLLFLSIFSWSSNFTIKSLGGSTLTLTSIVFPCLFYLWLAAAQKKSQEEKCPDDEICSFSEFVLNLSTQHDSY